APVGSVGTMEWKAWQQPRMDGDSIGQMYWCYSNGKKTWYSKVKAVEAGCPEELGSQRGRGRKSAAVETSTLPAKRAKTKADGPGNAIAASAGDLSFDGAAGADGPGNAIAASAGDLSLNGAAGDQSVSKRNFGGRVQRHHECQVCAISRHSFFHGNLCPECEYGLRKVGCRAYSRLTAEQKNRVIDMSRQSRASKASSQETAMAARLADAALILVRERLQNGE
ncbi:unnamed protein product, partial [Cladocopium goreaui]